MSSEYLDAKAIAQMLGVKEGTIRMYVFRREIPFIRLSGKKSPLRFSRASIDKWLMGKEQKAQVRNFER